MSTTSSTRRLDKIDQQIAKMTDQLAALAKAVLDLNNGIRGLVEYVGDMDERLSVHFADSDRRFDDLFDRLDRIGGTR